MEVKYERLTSKDLRKYGMTFPCLSQYSIKAVLFYYAVMKYKKSEYFYPLFNLFSANCYIIPLFLYICNEK